MLLANETVAEDYFWQEIPFVYRTHEAPDSDKIKKLDTFIHNFGYYMKTGRAVSYTHLDVYKRQVIGDIFFNYGFLTYFAIIITLLMAFFLKRTRWGLNLNAVGESPATADAAGINVTLYKYLATVIGGGIAGLGGLYFVMEYSGGTWTNNGFGDRGWLAIALVIFALWKPCLLYTSRENEKITGIYFSRCNDSITLCLRIFQRRSRRFHISERKFGSRRGSSRIRY